MATGFEKLQEVPQQVEDLFGSIRYTNPLREVLKLLERHHESSFAAQIGPGGEYWPPLAIATAAAKGHARIMHLTGALGASLHGGGADAIRDIIDEPSFPGATYGTRDEKAYYHQTGSGPPERPVVGFTDDVADQIRDIIADHVVGELVRGPLE